MHRLLPLTILLALAVAAPASATHLTGSDQTPTKRIGFNDVWGTHHGYGYEPEKIPGYVWDDIEAMGRILPDELTSNRLAISWAQVEPHDNVTEGGCAYYGGDWVAGHCYFWEAVDRLYDALRAQGGRPVLMVVGAPEWARPGMPCTHPSKPCNAYPPDAAHHDGWLYFVYRVIQRYGAGSRGLEVWNEPNLTKYWAPGPDPEAYAELVRIAYEARYYAGSSIPIATGGLSSISPNQDSPNGMVDSRFLRRVYASSPYMRDWFDAIGYHPYAGPDATVSDMWNHLDRMFAERDAAGDEGTPLWITEMGVSSAALGERGQGDRLVRLYKSIQGHPITMFLIHRFRDATEGGWIEEHTGVRKANGEYKYGSYCRIGGYFENRGMLTSPC